MHVTHENSSHNGVSIQLRQKIEDNGVFLVTQDHKVIAQLHLSQNLLRHIPEVDPASFPLIEFTPASRMETLETSYLQIKDIDARVIRVNLNAKIIGKSTRGTSSQGSAMLSLFRLRQSPMAPGL
jgi:hypothetical protein